jgi:hypothetical protein
MQLAALLVFVSFACISYFVLEGLLRFVDNFYGLKSGGGGGGRHVT